MTFKIYTDDGKVYGPYGSLPLAQKYATSKLIEHKLRKMVEIRPSFGGKGPFSKRTVGSFYKSRK